MSENTSEKSQNKAKNQKEQERNYAVENQMLKRKIQTLEAIINLKNQNIQQCYERIEGLHEKISNSNGKFTNNENNIKSKILELQKSFDTIKKHYISEIEVLNNQFSKCREDNKEAIETLQSCENVKQTQIYEANEKAKALEKNLEALASDFTDLLLAIIDKMTERLTLPHAAWELECDRNTLSSKIHDFSLYDCSDFTLENYKI